MTGQRQAAEVTENQKQKAPRRKARCFFGAKDI